MERTVDQIRELAMALPEEQRLLLALQLSAEVSPHAGLGEPEPGYEEWFRGEVEAALTDKSAPIPHEQVVKEMAVRLRSLRQAKRSKTSE